MIYKMVLILTILVALSLNAMVDANKVTFTKAKGRIYIETDSKHYAMFGQITDADGVRIVAVNDDTQYQQSLRCVTERSELNEVDPDHLKAYKEIRANYLKATEGRRGQDHYNRGRRRWSADISENQKYSVSKFSPGITAFSSTYFPSKLAFVIIDLSVIMFIHKNGHVTMKTYDCLLPNEKVLVKGIEKINTGDHLIPRMTPVGEETLNNYLKKHPFDEEQFYTEQEYIQSDKPEKRTWTKLLLPLRFDRSVQD